MFFLVDQYIKACIELLNLQCYHCFFEVFLSQILVILLPLLLPKSYLHWIFHLSHYLFHSLLRYNILGRFRNYNFFVWKIVYFQFRIRFYFSNTWSFTCTINWCLFVKFFPFLHIYFLSSIFASCFCRRSQCSRTENLSPSFHPKSTLHEPRRNKLFVPHLRGIGILRHARRTWTLRGRNRRPVREVHPT